VEGGQGQKSLTTQHVLFFVVFKSDKTILVSTKLEGEGIFFQRVPNLICNEVDFFSCLLNVLEI